MSDWKNERPVKAPKLLKANSLVETCASCGTWVERYPEFMGESEFWQCDKCGNTSVKVRQGRPYSKKSRNWGWINAQFIELFDSIAYWDWDTIVTDPPMKELDWKALDEWYQSRNMYGAVCYPHDEDESEQS